MRLARREVTSSRVVCGALMKESNDFGLEYCTSCPGSRSLAAVETDLLMMLQSLRHVEFAGVGRKFSTGRLCFSFPMLNYNPSVN